MTRNKVENYENIDPRANVSASNVNLTKSLSRPIGASKAALISPSHHQGRPVPDRSSLLPRAGPNDVTKSGNWDNSDAWTTPGLFSNPNYYEDSRDEVDFTTRPVNNVMIRMAHTASHISGKQVLQRAINPASPAEYPVLPISQTKQPSPKVAATGTRLLVDEEKLARLALHERAEVKVRQPVDSIPVKEPVKVVQSGGKVKVRFCEDCARIDSSLSAQRGNEPWIPPHLRIPKPSKAGEPVEDKASQPAVVVPLPPYLSSPRKLQNDQLDEVNTSAESRANDALGAPPHTTPAKFQSLRTSPHLVTDASSFLAQAVRPSNIINARMQPVDSATLATTPPAMEASSKAPEISSASLEHGKDEEMLSTNQPSTHVQHDQEPRGKAPEIASASLEHGKGKAMLSTNPPSTHVQHEQEPRGKAPEIASTSLEHGKGKAMLSTNPSSTQVRHDQEPRGKERDAGHGLPDTNILFNQPVRKGPIEPSLSNLSMRGDEVEKLSDLSGSLHFDDVFKASNPSDIYSKAPADGEPPYMKKKYDNSLRGWDGDWGPAPIEWFRRDMYDFNKPEHKVYVETFVINRIKAFQAGLCQAVMIDDEDFTQGRSLANGGLEFGKPIDESEHHHFRDTEPFTLHHLHNTAQISIDNFLRVSKSLLEKEGAKEARRLARAEKKARKQVPSGNEETVEPNNTSKVEKQARKQVISEKAVMPLPPNPYQPKANIYIRPARVKDLPQIRDLFNHYVETCAVTGERSKLSDRDWRDRFDTAITERFPFIVAVGRHQLNKKFGGEKVAGFAYAEDFGGEQTMWRHTCELQFYVHHTQFKKGVGKNLVDCMMRGLNSLYRAKAAVDFAVGEEEAARHDGGGERLLSHILVPYAYVSDQVEQTKWVGEWLTREFGFELQGTLKGIGRIGNPGKA
ncbi:MAG: hypothetical protein Q9202_000409 [Teloschistes flavicans]